jgi:hypothetical protein
MKEFDIIWKFAVIGFLLAITVSLGMIKFKIDDVENLLNVPEIELPEEYDEEGNCCLEDGQ